MKVLDRVPFNDEFANPIYKDYLYNYYKLEQFYRYNPWQEDSYQLRTEMLDKREANRPEFKKELAAVLRNFHLPLTNNTQVYRSIEYLAKPDTYIIAAGQQPGVLTGPLYCIYKALTAIKLAQAMSAKLGKVVIPVFWLASEDHDCSEVNWYQTINGWGKLNERGELVEYKFSPDMADPSNLGFSIGSFNISQSGQSFLETYRSIHKEAPYINKWNQIFSRTLEQSNTLAEWTGALLLKLFGKDGLIVIDPMYPGIKRLSAPVFTQAVELGSRTYEALNSQSQKLEKNGYSRRVRLKQGHTGLFYYHHGKRFPILIDKEGYKLERVGKTFSLSGIKREIQECPVNFSSNVALRPMVQDYIFPTLATVAGPGEVSYFSQLKMIYDLFQIDMPVIYPRESYALLPPDVQQLISKYQISPGSVLYDWELAKKSVLREQAPVDSVKIVEEAKGRIKQEHNRFFQEISAMDAEIWKQQRENFERISIQLEYIRKKSEKLYFKRQKQMRKELNYIRNFLYPHGKLQERQLFGADFLVYYDEKILDCIQKLPLNPTSINILALEDR